MSAAAVGGPLQAKSGSKASPMLEQAAASSSRTSGKGHHTRSYSQPKGLVSPSRSTTSLTLRPLAASPTPSAETYDAFVQAADPRHPDHAAWFDRYASLSQRASTSHTPQRPSFDRRRRRTVESQLPPAPDNQDGSDADDTGAWGQELYSRHGSTRSLNTPASSATQQRRRARDAVKPKPLIAPSPPPRVSSSMNWQSAFGSPPIPYSHEFGAPPSYHLHGRADVEPTHTSHIAAADESASANNNIRNDSSRPLPLSPSYAENRPLPALPAAHGVNMIVHSPVDARRGFRLPRFGSRSKTGRTENDQVMPSPSSAQSFAPQRYEQEPVPPRKSFSKIRQLLSFDASRPPLPEAKDSPAFANCNPHVPVTSPVMTEDSQLQLSATQQAAGRPNVEPDQVIDLDAFPLRLDNEFRENANEFETSGNDDDASEIEEIRLPWVSTAVAPHISRPTPPPIQAPKRSPGLVRRSLDSIVSPFRASMASTSNAANQVESPATTSEQIPAGRRSLSEMRLARPFMSRQRIGSVPGQARPLSTVSDQPDAETADVAESRQTLPATVSSRHDLVSATKTRRMPPVGIVPDSHESRRAPIWKRPLRMSMDMARRTKPPDVARSVATTHEPSLVLKDAQAPRRRMSSFLIRMRSSMSSSTLTDSQALTQPFGDRSANQAIDNTSSSVSPAQASRSRSMSFALIRGRSHRDSGPDDLPASESHNDLRQDDELFRRQLLTTAVSMSLSGEVEPARLPSAVSTDELDGQPCNRDTNVGNGSSKMNFSRSSMSLGKLLRRGPSGEAGSPEQSRAATGATHQDQVDSVTPRSSMSSAKGFDVLGTADSAMSHGPARLTIRKTLSPAIIHDAPRPDSEMLTPVPMRRSQSEPNNALSDQEELAEDVDDGQPLRSSVRRFARGGAIRDRLSRVDEGGERHNELALLGSQPSASGLASASLSDGAHLARNSVSEDEHGQAVSSARSQIRLLGRLRKRSMDVPRRKSDQMNSVDDHTTVAALPPNNQRTGSSIGSLAPPLMPISLLRGARTSFSQDRDRTPVLSSSSVPLTRDRSTMEQAFEKLRGKSRAFSHSKGVGPPDLIVLGLNDSLSSDTRMSLDTDAQQDSLGPRKQTHAGNRPERRPVPSSIDTPPRHVNTDNRGGEALNHTPVASATFGGLNFNAIDSPDGAVHVRPEGGEGSLMTSTTSEGTFSTLGAQTPENHSQATHIMQSQLPDLRAFEAMLGNFPRQEKVLLKDISARVMGHKTPMTSSDNLNSASTRR